MASISWLHITDWHVGQDNSEHRWPNLRAEVERDLADRIKSGGPLDLVFFSGDLVQSGAEGEFKRLEEHLSHLWNFFDAQGCAPKLVVVPGNHDLIRPTPSNAVALALKNWPDDRDIAKAFWNSNDDALRVEVSRWFANYVTWEQTTKIPLLPPHSKGPLPGDALYSFAKDGLRLGILGLNSTYLQYRKGDLNAKLALCSQQIPQGELGDHVSFLASHTITALITHHPAEWLTPCSKEEFHRDIAPSGRFDTHFCGHLHKADFQSVSKAGSRPKHILQGTSFFGLDREGESNLEVRRHGYTIGRWELINDSIEEKVWPRVAHPKQDGALQIIPDPESYLTEANTIERSWSCRKTAAPSEVGSISSIRAVSTQSLLSELGFGAVTDLSRLPRLQWPSGNHHAAVRIEERAQLEALIKHHGYVFLGADWGSGKDEFIATCLSESGADQNAFVLKCDAFDDATALETGFRLQFGMLLHQFLESVKELPHACLILDGIQANLTRGTAKDEFKRMCLIIRDFAPAMKVILVGRNPFGEGEPEVWLKSLDVLDTRAYVANHPLTQIELLTTDNIERIHFATGGLPLQIDRFLERLQVASLEAVLEEEATLRSDPVIEDSLTKPLRHCIQILDNEAHENPNLRSLDLLKSLTVLPFGDTIERMRRFTPRHPFYPSHAEKLLKLGLIESIPVHQTANQMARKWEVGIAQSTSPKILRVPKQIRDFVWSVMPALEQDSSLALAAEFIFGPNWRSSPIKLRSVPKEYQEYVTSGLGNEFAVIETLLARAASTGNSEGIRIALRLGIHYCGILKATDRHRDLRMVAGNLIRSCEGFALESELQQLHALCGRGCRFRKEYDEAVVHFRSALALKDPNKAKAATAHLMLELSLCLKQIANGTDEALEVIQEALKFAKRGSQIQSQLKAELIQLNKSGAARVSDLKELERAARSNKNRQSHANDLAIQLSADESDAENKLAWLDRAIASGESGWNEYRAAIAKAGIVVGSKTFPRLSLRDLSCLHRAYSHCHTQRQPLFDKCHRCLWEFYEHEQNLPVLYSIFRHSSFIWRLRGDEETEYVYLRRLKELESKELIKKPTGIVVEIEYFTKRAKVFVLGLIRKRSS